MGGVIFRILCCQLLAGVCLSFTGKCPYINEIGKNYYNNKTFFIIMQYHEKLHFFIIQFILILLVEHLVNSGGIEVEDSQNENGQKENGQIARSGLDGKEVEDVEDLTIPLPDSEDKIDQENKNVKLLTSFFNFLTAARDEDNETLFRELEEKAKDNYNSSDEFYKKFYENFKIDEESKTDEESKKSNHILFIKDFALINELNPKILKYFKNSTNFSIFKEIFEKIYKEKYERDNLDKKDRGTKLRGVGAKFEVFLFFE